MLSIALSWVLIPSLSWTFEKLFTPGPPAHVQFVVHATVDPSSETRFAHWLPDVAPDSPQRSRSREYDPAVTVSHCPQCTLVSTVSRASSAGAARDRMAKGRREMRVATARIVESISRTRQVPESSEQA